MNVLVTGGGGFVGLVLVKMLRARGDTVRTVARGDYPALQALGCEQVRGDLAEADVCTRATQGIDVVFHVAAKAGVWGTAAEYERSNITATENLLRACIDNGVAALVQTSTPSVTFDGGDANHADESLPYPEHHLFHYGRTKAVAERAVLAANGHAHARGNGALRTTALRPHLVYGPHDPHILPRFVQRARSGRMAIIGDGSNLVDVTYVDNAAHAHVLAAHALLSSTPLNAGKPYFISQGTPVRPVDWLNAFLRAIGVREITRKVSLKTAMRVGAVCEALWSALPLPGEPLMTRYVAAQLGTSHHYNLAGARRDFGYTLLVDDAEAFARTTAWLLEETQAGRM